MAARLEAISQGPELVDLRRVSAAELSPLLLEESVEWDQALFWDFSRSADLIRKFTDMRALDGAVLMDKGEVAGYGYSVMEDHKGLIGDLYVRPAWRDGEQELRLFRALLDNLATSNRAKRIEGQLMNVDLGIARALQRERFIRIFERTLMVLEKSDGPSLPQIQTKRRMRIEPWSDVHLDAASNVISLAYHNHVDSQINDQYRSLAGARRFLRNIVEFPGCGMFYQAASNVAVDVETGWLTGLSLASFVAEETGHITQLCVAPNWHGTGAGYEMLRRSIQTLWKHGAKRISLTVTMENQEAVRLYERCGFQDIHRFCAYVWEAV